ncbi:DNA repair protein RecO [Spirochaeta isovalerica]|uniref:DNA repair protein RecO n=1 Tax=Spirochaeta isovalerica TaxID=150 RepID=A0A841RG58_9SPIO|nr:DNA repair protein RecO [Spirochaeta isovalerica]MBB6482566.1 DNA repair protein RecO [Spirochaeta isovalerica]
MKRIQRSELIVLKSEKSGENHRLVTLFTSNSQIVRALAFGAAGSKSAMRGLTTPFCLCEGELYHDPVKDLWRITHLSGLDLYDGIRSDLKKFYTISLLAEIILKSYGGGDEKAYALFKKTIGFIDRAEKAEDVEKLLVFYLWRYLKMSGVLSDPWECGSCGRTVATSETVYYTGDGQFSCRSCCGESAGELNHRALNYLYMTSGMTFEEALPVETDQSILATVKKSLILIAQSLIEYPLKTLKTGSMFI